MTSQENQPRSKNYDCLYVVGHQSTDLYLTYCVFFNVIELFKLLDIINSNFFIN